MENTQKAYIQKEITAMIIQTLDGSLYANILNSLFALKEIPVQETKSKTFNLDVQEKKQKKVYIPPMSHLWKHASFQVYLMKQKHHNSGANV